jgi:hypothetical protein
VQEFGTPSRAVRLTARDQRPGRRRLGAPTPGLHPLWPSLDARSRPTTAARTNSRASRRPVTVRLPCRRDQFPIL